MAPCSRTSRTCICSSALRSWRAEKAGEIGEVGWVEPCARPNTSRFRIVGAREEIDPTYPLLVESGPAFGTVAVGGPVRLLVVLEQGGLRRVRPREATGVIHRTFDDVVAGFVVVHRRRRDLVRDRIGGQFGQGGLFR